MKNLAIMGGATTLAGSIISGSSSSTSASAITSIPENTDLLNLLLMSNDNATHLSYFDPAEEAVINPGMGVTGWTQFLPDSNWNKTGICKWKNPPQKNTIKGSFKVDIPGGKTYILSLAILDPAGNLPNVRFATANYLNGGRHPVGLVDVGKKQSSPLPVGFTFDDPAADKSLYYLIK